MPGQSNAPMIIALLCCLCFILPGCIYLVLWATNTICDKTSSEPQTFLGMNCASVYESTVAPSPSPGTALPAGSIKLINSETILDANHGNIPVENQPTGLTFATQPVQYTISFKILSTGASATSWREILQNYEGSSWNPTTSSINLAGNSPLFFIGPANDPVNANKLFFRQLANDNNRYELNTIDPLTDNKWYAITAVADTNKLTLYKDGVKIGEITTPGATNPLRYRNVNNFVWHPSSPGGADWTPVKIKEAYWWPRALTDAEVATVAATPSPSTTSTYVREPVVGYTK